MLEVLKYSISNLHSVEIHSYFKVASRKVYLKLVLGFKTEGVRRLFMEDHEKYLLLEGNTYFIEKTLLLF